MILRSLFIIVLFSQFLFSQNKSLRNANEEYLKSNYSKTIEKYNLVKRTKYALQSSDYVKLGHSYYHLGDYLNSKIHYDKAFAKSLLLPRNHIFNYLHLNLVYNDSVNYKKISKKFNISDTVIDKYLNQNTSVYLIDSLKIVDSIYNKFNYFKDSKNIYTQVIENGFTKNLFRSKDSLEFKSLFDFDFEINQGHFTFTENPDFVLITLNENNGKRLVYSGNKSRLKIYKLNINDSDYQNLKLLSIDQKKYSFSNPVFSNDYKKLFFVSDLKSGYGSSDIFFIDIHDDGSFSEIKNLGPHVNTNNRESYVSIDSDNNMYFSSNGHSGYGGLDIYKFNLDDENAYPINLGSEINSKYDEFYFNFYEDEIYFSSNRSGKDRTYIANYNNPLIDSNTFGIVPVSKTLLVDNSKVDEFKTIKYFNKTVVKDKVKKSDKTKLITIKPSLDNQEFLKPSLVKTFHIILGSFLNVKEANNLRLELLKDKKSNPRILKEIPLGFNRVSIKRFSSYRNALKELKNYIDLGYLDAWIVVY